MPVPIVTHLEADPPTELRRDAERLADVIRREHAELAEAGPFRELIADCLDDRPALHIDDLSEIARTDPQADFRFYQERARLRAGDGDFVASCADPVEGHQAYCRDKLGLGSPLLLRPRPPRNPLRIAEACWEDDTVRELLLAKLRAGELAWLHPFMGTFAVWELALLLHEQSGCPLRVVAPPPRVTAWTNNKVAFAETVRRLFGPEFVPRTESAWSLALLAQRVKELAGGVETIGLKLPDAAGSDGNVVLPADQLRGKSLSEIQQTLHAAGDSFEWRGDRELLVDVWETNVLCSPSAQLWIPPPLDGPPIIEGIFRQIAEGVEGMFTGAVPADLPDPVRQRIADYCWVLGLLFQRLGYVGRCSFDLILTGEDLRNPRLEFIECNGRWGGTSLPMTVMNRIFGDWAARPFAVHVYRHVAGLERVSFPELLSHFQDELFDVRSGNGSLVFYNPGRLATQAGISVILLGSTPENAGEKCRKFARRLSELAAETEG